MGRTPTGQTRHKVFRFVRSRLLAGHPPTIREVQEEFGFLSPQTAHGHLEGLVGEGRLAKDPWKARGYRLAGRENVGSPVMVPLLGRVPAGPLDVAVEDLEGYVPVRSSKAPEDLFALKVRGESMIGAGILPGDIVVVRREARAASGDIVVALVGDEATVKRLRFRRGRPELHSENPAFKPILPDPNDLKLLGKVVEVRRLLE